MELVTYWEGLGCGSRVSDLLPSTLERGPQKPRERRPSLHPGEGPRGSRVSDVLPSILERGTQ